MIALGEPWPAPVAPREPKEFRGNAVALSQLPFFVERPGKHPRGLHRAYGVGAGGANAHLEQVKSADRHD